MNRTAATQFILRVLPTVWPLAGLVVILADMSEKIGRVMRLALALTFIVGLVPHGIRAADADVKMVMAVATDMPMNGKCNGCGDNQKAMTAAACSASCGSLVGLPVFVTLFDPVLVETVQDFSGPTLAGHTIPPDPYPPRPVVLS